MVQPLARVKVVKKKLTRFKRHQSDRKITVKVTLLKGRHSFPVIIRPFATSPFFPL